MKDKQNLFPDHIDHPVLSGRFPSRLWWVELPPSPSLLVEGQPLDLFARARYPVGRVPLVAAERVDDVLEVLALVQLFPGHLLRLLGGAVRRLHDGQSILLFEVTSEI